MKIRAILIALFAGAFLASQLPAWGQETKDFSQGILSGKTTTTTRKLDNGHTITTSVTKATGTKANGEYVTLNSTEVREKDADGKPVTVRYSAVENTFEKKDGELRETFVMDQKVTYNEAGGYKMVSDSTNTNKLLNETTKIHSEEERDASNARVSGRKKITTNTPGQKPVVEERWNNETGEWETISHSGGHGVPGKKTTTGGHVAKRAVVASAVRGRRAASMYLYGKITSLEGCQGDFYKAFPKVGSGSLDGGKVTTKGGVFELDGSVAEYDPYRGTLMADGTFHLTSSRDAGTTIVGTIHQDNTISGTWHQVYDPSCAYDVTLVRGTTMSGSHVSVDGGGSWRRALSGLHQ